MTLAAVRNCRHVSVQDLLAARFAAVPGGTAVECGDRRLTYAQLLAAAGRVAGAVRDAGPDAVVGISVERTLDLPVTVLGVLLAGVAYIALPRTLPRPRLEAMIADAGARVVVTDDASFWSDHPIEARAVPDWEGAADAITWPGPIHPERLVYVTFTSGSTGRPKAIAMPQRAITNVLGWHLEYPPARTLQFASLAFDVSVEDLVAPWVTGGTVVMLSEAERVDPDLLLRVIADRGVQRLYLPASVLRQLAACGSAAATTCEALTEVVSSSEALALAGPVRAFFRSHPWTELRNEFGPSEAHTVTVHRFATGEAERWPDDAPIGTAVQGTTVRLLDRDLREVPGGEPGELFASGPQLARGYLGRPAETAARFLPDPHGAEPGGRMYRTGDVCRWVGGALEYRGRADHQVKVRGYRIELAEVEGALLRAPGVRAAAVTAPLAPDGGRWLVAHLELTDQRPGWVSELRRFLLGLLPTYSIPARYMAVAALPLSANGKIDRGRLPALDVQRPLLSAEYVAPSTEDERLVCDALGDVCGVAQVGVDDDFYDLGGSSMAAVAVAARLLGRTSRTVSAADVLVLRTAREMVRAGGADAWTREAEEEEDAIVPVQLADFEVR